MATFKITTTAPATETWVYIIEADTIEQARERYETESFDPDNYTVDSDEQGETFEGIEEIVKPVNP